MPPQQKPLKGKGGLFGGVMGHDEGASLLEVNMSRVH